jgi:hypothetical protein
VIDLMPFATDQPQEKLAESARTPAHETEPKVGFRPKRGHGATATAAKHLIVSATEFVAPSFDERFRLNIEHQIERCGGLSRHGRASRILEAYSTVFHPTSNLLGP